MQTQEIKVFLFDIGSQVYEKYSAIRLNAQNRLEHVLRYNPENAVKIKKSLRNVSIPEACAGVALGMIDNITRAHDVSEIKTHGNYRRSDNFDDIAIDEVDKLIDEVEGFEE